MAGSKPGPNVDSRQRMVFLAAIVSAVIFAATPAAPAQIAEAHALAEDPAWLRYAPLQMPAEIPISVRALSTDQLEQSAVQELESGLAGFSGQKVQTTESGEIVVGTIDEVRAAFPGLQVPVHLAAHGFWLKKTTRNGWRGHPLIIVAGSNDHGALFGEFDLLRRMATGADLPHLDAIEAPAMSIRWVDEWDNASCTVERGYGGRSIFFEGGKVRDDLSDVTKYARLLASVGINGCNVNNVNGA